MFSTFKNILNYIKWKDEASDIADPLDDYYNEILAQATTREDEEKIEHHERVSLPVLPALTTQCRMGTITKLNENDGVIDHMYFFDRRDAQCEGLDEGKKVMYRAFRKSETTEWKVTEIMTVLEESWDEDKDVTEREVVEELESKVITSGIANTRNITGRVQHREGREVFVRDVVQHISSGSRVRDTRFSLNSVSSTFTPVEGLFYIVVLFYN